MMYLFKTNISLLLLQNRSSRFSLVMLRSCIEQIPETLDAEFEIQPKFFNIHFNNLSGIVCSTAMFTVILPRNINVKRGKKCLYLSR